MPIDQLALPLVFAVFLAAAALIALAGTRLARIADELAVRTGLGEVMVGAVFVGASTSLPGIVTSVVTAAEGHVGLATGNALGGIAAQTAFLGIADLAYRRANLEHVAASVGNLVQGALLVALLAIALVAANLPPVAIMGVSPATVILICGYFAGLRLMRAAGAEPMWRPTQTIDTQREEEEVAGKVDGSTLSLWVRFVLLGGLMAGLGYVVSQTGITLAERTWLSDTAVGALFTAIATSLPELVIAVAAVRIGAFNLAVGDIIGGNCFDILFLAAADIAYRDGSIYGEFTSDDRFLVSGTLLMLAVLLLGLLHRERTGFARIGFETTLILSIYAGMVLVMTTL